MKKAVVLRELNALMTKYARRRDAMRPGQDGSNSLPDYPDSWDGVVVMNVAMTLLGDTIAALRQMK